MDEDFLSTVEEFSERERDVMEEIVLGDNGFHSLAFASKSPFLEMLSEDENGMASVYDKAEATIGDGATEFSVSLDKSSENESWFFTVSFNDEKFAGILRFNTVYNAMGRFAFAFVNSNDGSSFDDITKSLPYTAFFAMVK